MGYLTPQIAERLEWLASQGFDDDKAAEMLGIGRTTLYRWLNDPRPEFREWQARVVRAEAMAVVPSTAARSTAIPIPRIPPIGMASLKWKLSGRVTI